MTDKELLERAARAAGIRGRYREDWDAIERSDCRDSFQRGEMWRPHKDDGDAFRLMVDCNMSIIVHLQDVEADGLSEPLGDDWRAATRRAIVRAAAMAGGDA